MIREIVEIDEAKCDGCGKCLPSCAEGALYLEGGKVKLKADALCDGFGVCLGICPTGALRVVKREAPAFDEAAVHAALAAKVQPPAQGAPRPRLVMAPSSPEPSSGCPGSRPRTLVPVPAPGAAPRRRLTVVSETVVSETVVSESVVSEGPPPVAPQGGSRLGQWPVQLHLVSPGAPYLKGADLLIAADCVPFAYARFHEDLLEGRRVLVGCPKLDDVTAYAGKLTELFRQAQPRSVTVARMEVPCCGGIVQMTRQALAASGFQAPLEVVTVGIAGEVVDRRSS